MKQIKVRVPDDESVPSSHIFQQEIQQAIHEKAQLEPGIQNFKTNNLISHIHIESQGKISSHQQRSQKTSLKRSSLSKNSESDYGREGQESSFDNTSILNTHSQKNFTQQSQRNCLTQVINPKIKNNGTQMTKANTENPKSIYEKQKFQGLFDKNNALKVLIRKQKADVLANNFLTKLKRNINLQKNVKEFEFEDEDSQGTPDSFLNMNGWKQNVALGICMSFMNITTIVVLTFFVSLALVYEEINHNYTYKLVQIISFSYFCFSMLIKFFTVKEQSSKKLVKLKDIWLFYLKDTFWIDICIIFLIGFDFAIENTQLNSVDYLKLMIVFKWPQVLSEMEKLELKFIRNFYNEQYYMLLKVFLINFCIAHFLAISLDAMTSFNPQLNWMTVFEIAKSAWYIKYIWSFYFGTTIMLTVGFGDIAASNPHEAVCIVFIETFTCIVLAYNINCVGNLISNLRSHSNQKSKNKKIFNTLSENNSFSEGVSKKIANTIQQSVNLKKKFNVEEEKRFVENLPSTLKKEYLKESNRQVFQKISFFKNLVEKTLCNIAQKIETKISYPDQIVKHLEDDFNLIILKKGSLGYVCKKYHHPLNDRRVNSIHVKEGEAPLLTSFDFINKKRQNFEIKSLQYSILYFMKYEDLISALAENPGDYETYCVSRDKMHLVLDEFEIIPCENCTTKHSKFNCPKVHFLPYQKQVIQKYLYQFNHNKTQRKGFLRNKTDVNKPLFLQKQNPNKSRKLTKLSHKKCKYQSIRPMSCQFFTTSESQIMNESSTTRSYTRMQQLGEIMKVEFSKLQKKQEDDNVWIINLDTLFNYKTYFPRNNPNNLEEKFDSSNRKNVVTKYESEQAFDGEAEDQQSQSHHHDFAQFNFQ